MRKTASLSLLVAMTMLCAAASQAEQGPAPADPPSQAVATTTPEAPKPLKRAPLRYPPKGESANLDGEAKVEISIDADGSVSAVKLLYENPEGYGFGKEAVKSVRNWTFQPNIAGTYVVTMKFDLAWNDLPVRFNVPDLKYAPEPYYRVPLPEYPEAALKAGLEGKAELVIHVNQTGRVSHVGMIKEWTTSEDFAAAAGQAVVKWKYPDSARNQSFKVRIDFTRDALAKGLITAPD